MESLRESNADQLVQVAGQRAPARVLVVAQAEQVDVPKHLSQSPDTTNRKTFSSLRPLLFR